MNSRLSMCYALIVLVLGLGQAFAQAEFESSLRGPWRMHGEPGTQGTHRFSAHLRSSGLEGAPGIQAWVLGVAAEGMQIVDWTYAGTAAAPADNGRESILGLRSDGFENTQLVTAATGESGVISAVVLSYREPVTLPDGVANRVLSFATETDYPATAGECRPVALRFVDGLQGTGGPVRNIVTQNSLSIIPTKKDLEAEVCGAGRFGFSIAGETETEVAPGEGPAVLEPVAQLRTSVDGIQGWSMSVLSLGPCEMLAATTDGTIGGEVSNGAPGLRDSGFEKTEIADPLRNGGRTGAVSAVVLSFTEPASVPAGEHVALRMTLSCDSEGLSDGDSIHHRLVFPSNNGNPPVDGLLRGIGQPVKSAVTFDGNTIEPDVTDGDLRVIIRTPQVADFRRCDPNNDTRYNIADAIWIVNELFRNGAPTACLDAGDCNDDQLLDVSDAIFSIDYQFDGGVAPPAPFPECGTDLGVSEDRCPAGSTACF